MIRDKISEWLYAIDPFITPFTHMTTMQLMDTLVMRICGTPQADIIDWFSVDQTFCLAAACLSIVRKGLHEKSIDKYLKQVVKHISRKPCKLDRLKREILRIMNNE